MKFSLGLWAAALGAVVIEAAYSGDIVKYWYLLPSLFLLPPQFPHFKTESNQTPRVDQTAILINGTIIGGLQSPPSAWAPALVQGAQYLAALNSQSSSLSSQQLAVSHAAHNTLSWLFHGTRNFAPTDAALETVQTAIGLDPTSDEGAQAIAVGKAAARKFAYGRADDGSNDYVAYVFGPLNPGVYQATPGGNPLPDTPQAQFVTLFAGVGNVTQFDLPPPPVPTAAGSDYQGYLLYVKEQGEWNSTVRTPFDTDTAYFWRESSPT
jgi:hypothetical protein